ncbi:hypothetical protein [Halobacillus sp. A5]|uniref:hypothetical protein n=1 Tax=Halobacillus sp. A5 TaxID=2880263 RepID=UPI0020A68FD0|nr:hypothetical protein [Halobacillus sp. A5]MCP3025654.1 hypothetical protein [Halobacillus sp. A5]
MKTYKTISMTYTLTTTNIKKIVLIMIIKSHWTVKHLKSEMKFSTCHNRFSEIQQTTVM